MKRKLFILLMFFILFPLSVNAEEYVYINCDGIKHVNGDEIKCDIKVDVDYIVTNVSGEIVLDDNLELISSSYDEKNWLMLDDEFSVKSINLISEEKVERDIFVLASFVVKAKNKKNVSNTPISFENVIIGDENYEDHNVKVDDFALNLSYESTNNLSLIILFISLVIIVFIWVKLDDSKVNKKKVKSKKVKSIILIFILLLFPSWVDAANNININCGKTKLNKNEEINCTLSVSNLNFIPTDVSGKVSVGNNLQISSSSYNKSVWTSFDSVFNVKDINLIRQSKNSVSSITIATFKVKASSSASGSSTITFSNVVMGDSNYNSVSLGSRTINVTFNSSENNLSSLSVNEGNINFSQDKTNYSLNVDADSITINAVAVSNKAKISGTGKKNLNYGENTFNVIVTAEDGSKKTYTIKVNRKDDRSTNNYLKSLSLSTGNISFNKNTNSYSVEVDSDVSSVNVSASLEDSKAKFVNGFGPRKVNLNYGKNVVLVKVLSENEKERVYTLNINRKDNRSNDTSLRSITISHGEINFKKDKYEYYLSVENEVETIEIDAVSNDSKSKVEITGPKELEIGENVFVIKVTAENGSMKEYKINVTREKKVTITENNKIKNIEIKNHEFQFSSDKYEYTLKTNEKELDIVVTLFDEESTYVINGNEALEDGSIISIVITDKDDNYNIYKIYIENYYEVDYILVLLIISLILNVLFIFIIISLISRKRKHRKAS